MEEFEIDEFQLSAVERSQLSMKAPLSGCKEANERCEACGSE
jgi:hypothetical protein